MITKDRCYIPFDFSFREERDGEQESLIVEGQPVVFNQETVIFEWDGVEYKEKIDPNAFDGAMMSDVVLNVNHEGKPAAKTRNGTLELFVKTSGLFVRANLAKNVTGRELYEDIKNGFFDKMSFAFTARESSYDKDTRTRTILKIKRLWDVAAVTWAAYEQTIVVARSWAEVQAEIEAAEAANRDAEASEKAAEAAKRMLEIERLRAKALGLV